MREAGPIAKVFENQQVGLEGQNDTKPYIPTARTLLGQLKNRMAQGGLDSGRMVRDLEDGTRIIVTSVMGQDKIHIIAPSAERPERVEPEYPIPVPVFETPEVPTPPLEIDGRIVAACGYLNDTVGDVVACIWRSLSTAPEVIWESGVALAISENGSTVVGYHAQSSPLGAGSGMPCRWTTEGGMMDIPGMDPDSPLGAATCVNATGSVVAGYGRRPGGGNRAWVWTAAGGTVDLPDEGLGASVSCISPNGLWAAGTVGTPLYGPTPDTSINGRAIVWRCDENGTWTHTLPPRPSGSSRQSSFQGPVEGPRPDSYFPVNIDDLGRAIFRDDHLEGFYVTQYEKYWPYHEGGTPLMHPPAGGGEPAVPGQTYMTGPNSWYQTTQPAANRFHLYEDGGVRQIGEGSAVGCSDEVRVVIGAESHGTLVSIYWFGFQEGHHVYNSEGDHATDFYSHQMAWSPFYVPEPGFTVTRSWWWSERRGKVTLTPDDSLVRDISEDGTVIVGFRRDMSDIRTPVYWLRGRGANAIDMSTGGYAHGECNGVARPRTPKTEDGGAPPIIPR